MAKLSGQALILRRFAFGESSLVLQVLTREHGRVHLIAKGAYRTTSRYFAALDLFDTLDLEWSQARGRELQTLQGARILERRACLSHDLARYRAALTTLELAAAAAREGQRERELYDLSHASLERLARGRVPALLAAVVFELAFLHNLGLAPALGHCAACGRPAPAARAALRVAGRRARAARAAFSAGAGGRLCRTCAGEARGSGRRVGTLPLDVLELARSLLETSDPDDDGLERTAALCDAGGLERLRDFVERFLEFHIEARPRSFRAFLEQGNRNAPVPG